MIHFRLALAAAAALALAACAENSPVADEARQGDPTPAIETANHNAAASAAVNAAARPDAVPGTIPAALQGRWGLTPADCEPKPVRSQGLLEVSADELRFYESVARPGQSIESDEDSISGDWAFQSEGMTEQRFQSLQLQDGKLVRSENNPARSFTYVRCDA